jgi:hypothetical protein
MDMAHHFPRSASQRGIHINTEHVAFSISEWNATGFPPRALARGCTGSVLLVNFGDHPPTVCYLDSVEKHSPIAERMAARRISLTVVYLQ